MAQRSVGPGCRRIGGAPPPQGVSKAMARFSNRRERRLDRHSRSPTQTLERRERLGQTVVSKAIELGVLHDATRLEHAVNIVACSDVLIKPAAACDALFRGFRRWTQGNDGRRLRTPNGRPLLERMLWTRPSMTMIAAS